FDYIKLRKPLTSDVRVLGPVIVNIDLDITVTRFAAAAEEDVNAAVLTALEDYAENLQLGEGLILSRLLNRIMDVPGVYNVQITSPNSDRLVGVDTFVQIGDVNIVHRIKGRTYQDQNIPGATLGDEQTSGVLIPGVNQTNFGLQQGMGE
ncbi:MAG: baseplate J/gp47 family protein, partial [FCB group bacterium]|nr:baseplate J/gp47 family protein [FCB group bacterium]